MGIKTMPFSAAVHLYKDDVGQLELLQDAYASGSEGMIDNAIRVVAFCRNPELQKFIESQELNIPYDPKKDDDR